MTASPALESVPVSAPPRVRKPELLAPAGDRGCLRAAIENGADAVYFGLTQGFNARARATNLDLAALPEIMAELHHRGVKGYVTLNTLVFTNELPEVEQTVRELATAGVDAVLVQDLGLVRLIRSICPDLSIHASTQMTLTSAECINVAEELGIERVVLPRELSIREIDQIHGRSEVELEAFVHGALCVAYSGQCLTSESLGGRSANRGQCAQACRLPYELICDGADVDLGAVKYLLSPQDLAAYALAPELLAAGICSFKIEGRLKTPEYVANMTRYYRRAIDAAFAGQPVAFSADDVREMELSFSRGFSPGWLEGNDHKRLVPGLSSAKRGVCIGSVVRVQQDRVLVRIHAPISRGDGVVFEGDRVAGAEQGGRVYGVFRHGHLLETPATTGVVELAFMHDSLDLEQIEPGLQVWKTDDPQLTQRLRKSFTGPDPLRKQPVDMTVRAVVGDVPRLSATTESGQHVAVEGEVPLEVARKHPVSETWLREQLSRLGHTPYELRLLDAVVEGAPMLPMSVLSGLRRELIARLDAALQSPPARRIADEPVLPVLRSSLPDVTEHRAAQLATAPRLRWLCRTLEQIRAVLATGAMEVTAELQDIREYREAVAQARAAGAKIWLATLRIQKPDEAGLFRALVKHEPDGLLVRNLAGVRYCAERQLPFVADFSLNATNELTVQYLREQGAERVTASYDLNREQLLDLVGVVPPDWLEVVVHQHMPMFHMEHCVFCAVMSPGTNKTNCGRPCDVHKVELRDRVGMEHPLKADVGCRNTLYNAVPQSSAEIIPTLIEQGLRDFRIELLEETADDIHSILKIYSELLAGRVRGPDVWQQLKAMNRVGVTRGTLEERRNPLAIL